ncbi:aldose epimerase family protein [Planktotalea sp.]|uniref:aldose epimerase family protein n=1 Tax=Planktotalea sp. TaxID=2029877 RepID=UPI00329837CF
MITAFGHLPDGRLVQRVQLENNALKVGLISYGASLQSLNFDGSKMTIGSDVLEDYLGRLKFAGAIVGRVANRIAGARYNMHGSEHVLDANEPSGNCLHGGLDGAGCSLWEIKETSKTHAVFSLHMADGHMGFPGALDVTARYELKGAALRLEISAVSDSETLCGFAPHGFWNLSAEPNINGHEMRVAADQYLPVDDQMIPIGAPVDVANSTFDFRTDRAIGTTDLDHNFCLSTEREMMRPIVWLRSPASGVSMEVASTETGVQIFDGRNLGRAGLAIEPQVWPDAINQKDYPKITLGAGETYRASTEFRFYSAT